MPFTGVEISAQCLNKPPRTMLLVYPSEGGLFMCQRPLTTGKRLRSRDDHI